MCMPLLYRVAYNELGWNIGCVCPHYKLRCKVCSRRDTSTGMQESRLLPVFEFVVCYIYVNIYVDEE